MECSDQHLDFSNTMRLFIYTSKHRITFLVSRVTWQKRIVLIREQTQIYVLE